jgi:hypothetical protein
MKTAVEWLFENLDLTGGSEALETLNKALKMEKEQIIKSNYDGIKFGWEDAINEFKSKVGMINKSTEELSEQYYTETFEQQEQ